MFILRAASVDDLDDLFAVALHLDSVNLPHNRARLRESLERSGRSFAATVERSQREFIFVIEDRSGPSARVVGSSMVFAQHGSRKSPHVYFDVIDEERYSESLDRHFVHRVLRIGYTYTGLTEVGGLALLPAYRGRAERLGQLLSYIRFVFIAMNRALFCDEIVSELMPPLEPDGASLLWEALGRKFTGLSYQEADRLSHENKEFIRALFPQEPIYTCLLPERAQRVVGEVGPATKGVEALLRQIGFTYASRIDPFDGGPHFHAATDDVAIVRDTRILPLVVTVAVANQGSPGQAENAGLHAPLSAPALVARQTAAWPYFVAVRTHVAGLENIDTGPTLQAPLTTGVSLDDDARAALDVQAGDPLAVLRLATPRV